MARARMISCSLSTSERFAKLGEAGGELGEFAQALYMLIVVHADDFGRTQGDPFSIKYRSFPASPRSIEQFEHVIELMHQVGLVVRYADDTTGRKYLAINDFDQHQQGLKKRTKSRFPEPPGNSWNFTGIPSEEKRREEKRSTPLPPIESNESNTSNQPSRSSRRRASAGLDASAVLESFDAFWTAYPKRQAKQAALKAWRHLAPDASLLAAILAGVSKQAATPDWRKAGGQFVPLASTWLHGRRWEDEVGAGGQAVEPMGYVHEDGWQQTCDWCKAAFDPGRYPDGSFLRVHSCPSCRRKAADVGSEARRG